MPVLLRACSCDRTFRLLSSLAAKRSALMGRWDQGVHALASAASPAVFSEGVWHHQAWISRLDSADHHTARCTATFLY